MQKQMQLTVLQSALKSGVAMAARAVAGKSTLPILSNILMTAKDGRLRLQATNLEIGITCYVGAKVQEAGATTLNAKLLQEWISNLGDAPIQMNLNPEKQIVNLKAGGNESNIHGIEADEFPSIPSFDNEPLATIQASVLRDAIKQVAYAAADNDSMRPVITGVCATFIGTSLTLAAIDGFRLAVKTLDIGGEPKEHTKLIIPARTLDQLAALLPNEGVVDIVVSANTGQVLFRTEGFELLSRLLDGQFPDYERMIPKQYSLRAVAARSDIGQAARGAKPFAESSANIVRLDFQPPNEDGLQEQAKIILSANAAEVGTNKTELPAQIASGEGMFMAVNCKYLEEAISNIGTPQVALEVQTAAAPLVLRPIGDDSLMTLIMPMTIR